MVDTNFSSLSLNPPMLANLASLGFDQMTPIQAASLPHILGKKDLIARAKTGSGKTATFGIGVLEHIDVRKRSTQALILCPTRELADQVGRDLRKLARFIPNVKIVTLCGGTPIGPQYASLEHGAHVVVGTPGRLEDHLRKGSLHLAAIRIVVLDEADRMLDMGFADAIHDIVALTPTKRQTLMFSATYPSTIMQMSETLQNMPVDISVDTVHLDNAIEQLFCCAEKEQKIEILTVLLHQHRPESSLVFCNFKAQCDEVAAQLRKCGFDALAIHGDLEQRDRDDVLTLFSNKSCAILVATDVAARGLHINDLNAVINYELPRDPNIYTHRIGRTGRAGKKGLALSLYSHAEKYRLTAIKDMTGIPVTLSDAQHIKVSDNVPPKPPMKTICIAAGSKNKLRAGDILGALTKGAQVSADQVGKIDVFHFHTFVAVRRAAYATALDVLANGKIKGRSFKVRGFH